MMIHRNIFSLIRFKFLLNKNFQDLSMPPSTTFQKICEFFSNLTFLYILPYWYIINTFLWWQNMSNCLCREALLNSIFLIYLRFAHPNRPSILLEILQILTALWFVDHTNASALEEEPTCLDTDDSLYLQLTHILFKTLLWCYTVSTSLLAMMLIGAIVFGILELFVWQPQRTAQQGLSEAEFNQLKHIKFALVEEIHGDSSLSTCTICLEEFQEGLEVIQLPCNHYFHPPCVSGWLKYHIVCPNCRTNVRGRLNPDQQDGGAGENSEIENQNEA